MGDISLKYDFDEDEGDLIYEKFFYVEVNGRCELLEYSKADYRRTINNFDGPSEVIEDSTSMEFDELHSLSSSSDEKGKKSSRPRFKKFRKIETDDPNGLYV
ncbi:hypothetical protein ACH5RR_009020 [Cinchona calisaya]|uniref:Uncharacterized protein n=1 Tax=Cinchona calisaya TaxID=153742 RepID=A0ABD3AI23_9GENT